MLSDAREMITTAPWIPLFPGLAIFLTVLGLNLLGDGLRDYLDPQSRSRRS
jgi:peptide/nickel transport system permease protein